MTNARIILFCLLFVASSSFATTKSTTHHSASHKKSTHQSVNIEADSNQSSSSTSSQQSSGYQCEGKRRCGDMDSCEEAEFYLNHCGQDRLDRDHDGIPCESLCE